MYIIIIIIDIREKEEIRNVCRLGGFEFRLESSMGNLGVSGLLLQELVN